MSDLFSALFIKTGATDMNLKTVALKPETRNHKGCFVQNTQYTFVEIDKSGWALICVDDAVCHYVDPDNLLAAGIDGNIAM